ncbi:MAG: hypothetical protein M1274_02185 [Actinobacteria bacterium]|nr:hypothetical protein [Actinomycetota bacterium]
MAVRPFRFLSAGSVETEPETGFIKVEAREVLAVRRALLPGRSLSAQASLVYVTVLTLGIIAVLLWGIWGRVGHYLVEIAGPYQFIWGPPAILLVILAILRYNTLQGFVSFSEPDCAHVLTAPVSRRGLTGPRLRATSIIFGCAGALLGMLAGLATGGAATTGVHLGEEAAGGFALGLILVAAGWQVQRSTAVSRWVIRLTLPALAIAVLLTVARSRGGLAGAIALWSGPWGWSVLPAGLPASGQAAAPPAWQGVAGLSLLWACAIAGVASLVVSAGRCSLEGFQRRARTRSRLVASLYSFDVRSAMKATRQAGGFWRWRVRLRVPHRAVLAPAWRDLLGLLRSPLRLGWAIALAAGAALLFAIGNGGVGTSWGGALLLYLAASAFLEPLRAETDSPAASHLLLPWSYGRVLWLHCLLPSLFVFATGFVAALGGLAAGRVHPESLLIFVIVWIPLAPMVVLAAALSSRRGGRASSDLLLMTSGDSTGLSMITLLIWVFGWAIAAIVVTALGMGRILRHGSPVTALVVAMTFVVVILILRAVLLATKPGGSTGSGGLFSPTKDALREEH